MAQIIAPESIVDLTVDQKQTVTDYVYSNYKSWKDKPLEITQTASAIFVRDNKDSSPIVLGLAVLYPRLQE